MSARNSSKFTVCQWRELQHQTLIYSYIASEIPIPPDLLLTVKTTLNSPKCSRPFSHQDIGWKSLDDPEPGRCRRTDGKKWRCSKEAYRNSKYCEQHMHRGRNRSRKPVERISFPHLSPSISSSSPVNITNTKSTTVNTAAATSFYTTLSTTSSTITSSAAHSHSNCSSRLYPAIPFHFHPPQYTGVSSSSRPPASSLLILPHLSLDSGSCSHPSERNNEYLNGNRMFTKETTNEKALFPQTTHYGLNFQNLADPEFKEHQHQDKHSFVLGFSNMKNPAEGSIKDESEEGRQQHHKSFHQFFSEWSPPKCKPKYSWPNGQP